MLSLAQEETIIMIRALSYYMTDLLKNADYVNASKVAKMIYEASHNVSTK